MSESATGSLVLDLRKHSICFFLPEGAVLECSKLELPGGALLMGTLIGNVVCRTGSLIVPRAGVFSGRAMADKIFIEGTIKPGPKNEPSVIHGHTLVALSQSAQGSANLISQAFAIHTKVFEARFKTLQPAAAAAAAA